MVVPLPTSLPSGHEPSADEFQAILDLLSMWTLAPAPTTSNSTGTITSGTTETRDAVLGDFAFTVPTVAATWRFEAIVTNVKLNFTTADDLFAITIRDGGGSSPTSASTLVAELNVMQHLSGGTGQMSWTCSGSWVPGAGVHTLSMFLVRRNGAGTAQAVAGAKGRELYVKFVGIN